MRGVEKVLGDLLPYSVSLLWRTMISSSAENLAQFLGAGTRSREVWVLVGCLGLVIFLCIISLRFILWNLSDPVFIATGQDHEISPL